MQKLDLKEAWGADKLEAELESARDELRGLDKNIRKILGKDLPDGENAPLQQTQRFTTRLSNLFMSTNISQLNLVNSQKLSERLFTFHFQFPLTFGL